MISAIYSLIQLFLIIITPIIIVLLKVFNLIDTGWIEIYIAWTSSLSALFALGSACKELNKNPPRDG